MNDCIKRNISIIKSSNLFSTEYETKEITEHEFIDSDVEYLKLKASATSYFSGSRSERIIYCKYCGQITHKDSNIFSYSDNNSNTSEIKKIKSSLKNKKTKK
jgi:hypothetical protein